VRLTHLGRSKNSRRSTTLTTEPTGEFSSSPIPTTARTIRRHKPCYQRIRRSNRLAGCKAVAALGSPLEQTEPMSGPEGQARGVRTCLRPVRLPALLCPVGRSMRPTSTLLPVACVSCAFTGINSNGLVIKAHGQPRYVHI